MNHKQNQTGFGNSITLNIDENTIFKVFIFTLCDVATTDLMWTKLCRRRAQPPTLHKLTELEPQLGRDQPQPRRYLQLPWKATKRTKLIHVQIELRS